eukprot:jgi/Botrbrau1/3558/Bobra.0078s0015.1
MDSRTSYRPTNMGYEYVFDLPGKCGYVCSTCKWPVADHDDLISKNFTGRFGKAYLFQTTVNYILAPAEDRMLITGLHTVADMKCRGCNSVLGWKYEEAFEPTQKYKVGKFIVERAQVEKVDLTDVLPESP